MNYLLYSFCFFLIAISTAAFATRTYWIQYLPQPIRSHLLPPLPQSWARRLSLFPTTYTDEHGDPSSAPSTPSRPSWTRRFSLFKYQAVPTTHSFQDDAAAGLHSSNFDLAGNIESGDQRSGLDEQGKKEVLAMMRKRGVGFDEARRMVMQEKFRKAGVGTDGVPRDPKFVSFS